jgi:dihydrofolate synthase / folylpolyglutamate synthase
VTDLPTPRAATAEMLERYLREAGVADDADHGVQRFDSAQAAFAAVQEKAGENDRIVVFGSHYTVADVMAYRKLQHH